MVRRKPALLLVALLAAFAGCDSAIFQEYALPDRLVGSDGQVFTVEDLQAIADDSGLSTEAKRQAFRDLGIEDPDLIEALLNL